MSFLKKPGNARHFFTFLHHLHILKKKNEIHGFIISFPAAQLLAVADEYGLGLPTFVHAYAWRAALCMERDQDLQCGAMTHIT